MPRILAIDYWKKRVGIAATDPLQIIATGIGTIHAKDLLTFLDNYIKEEEVECIVVGEPKRMNNEPSEIGKAIDELVVHFRKRFSQLKIERMDERFTSKLAFDAMLQAGVKKKDRRNKELIDEASAVIILQSYIEKQKNNH